MLLEQQHSMRLADYFSACIYLHSVYVNTGSCTTIVIIATIPAYFECACRLMLIDERAHHFSLEIVDVQSDIGRNQ